MSDEAILGEIGARLAAHRVDLQLTQAAVAEQAGVAKRTLERMEAGQSSQLSSLIRVLRALDAMAGLESLVAEAGPRPMDLLQRKGKRRQRASGRRGDKTNTASWEWGDDS